MVCKVSGLHVYYLHVPMYMCYLYLPTCRGGNKTINLQGQHV